MPIAIGFAAGRLTKARAGAVVTLGLAQPALQLAKSSAALATLKAPIKGYKSLVSPRRTIWNSQQLFYGLVPLSYVVATPKSPAGRSTMITFGGGRFERQASQILPNLYLTDAMTARWGDTLDRLGVTRIVCVMEEPVTYPRTKQDVKILHIPVPDNVTSDLLSYFESATEFISDALGPTNISNVNQQELSDVNEVKTDLEGRPHPFPSPDADRDSSSAKDVVLVHCLAGMSRSATIVCAYLLATTSMNTQETIAFVRSKRPIIQPNYGFERQLKAWEVKHFVATRKRRVSSKQIAADLQGRMERYKAAAAGARGDDDD